MYTLVKEEGQRIILKLKIIHILPKLSKLKMFWWEKPALNGFANVIGGHRSICTKV